jgi:4'-phosphopantetheinyl transferase
MSAGIVFSSPGWSASPPLLLLGANQVHVWCVALDQPDSRVRSLWHTLAPDEQGRAERFHFRRDREHFIIARGLLRQLIGRYLGIEAHRLRFCYNSYGKPGLAEELNPSPISFNLSHSQGLALFAFTHQRELGVDIEYVRPEVVKERIAEHFFSRQEVAVLRALPAAMQAEAFFNCWTRKEAYVKAKGEGLSLPLDQFDVSLTPGDEAALLATRGDPREASRWSLQALHPAPDYIGALALEGHRPELKCWRWSE